MEKNKLKITVQKLKQKSKPVWAKTQGVWQGFYSRHKQFCLTVAIILVGVLLAVLLIVSKRPPKKVEVQELAPLVKTAIIESADIQMMVHGFGSVKAEVEVQVAPQVSGKVVSVNPQFKAGGVIPAGNRLFQIEPKDFQLALQQARATVAAAKVSLDMEKSEAAVAVREWQQINPGTEPDSALVLRQPQILQATAQLDSAKAAMAKAELDLERTNVTLPIDVCITAKSVDLGQFVAAAQAVADAYGVDKFEIEVPLEDSELKWFKIPCTAKVKADFAGEERIYKGTIKRTTGKVDKTSRLVYVAVEVDSNDAENKAAGKLLPGTFVEISIEGQTLKNILPVNRDWIHNAGQVWVVNDNDVLNILNVDIIRTDDDYAYIKSDSGNIKIVTSTLDVVVDGMKIRQQAAE